MKIISLLLNIQDQTIKKYISINRKSFEDDLSIFYVIFLQIQFAITLCITSIKTFNNISTKTNEEKSDALAEYLEEVFKPHPALNTSIDIATIEKPLNSPIQLSLLLLLLLFN